MRSTIIAGNWKMYKTPSETDVFLRELMPLVKNAPCEVVVAPPFPCLAHAAAVLAGSTIALAAQNLFWESQGAFTGEVSGRMLTDLGVKYAIIGHSERRQFFGETDDTVNNRVMAALSASLIPIICVGETLGERELGKTRDIVSDQLRCALSGVSPDQVGGIVIAYEPVWAIGTGIVATTEQAQQVHAGIRRLLTEEFGKEAGAAARIQYGGSVKPDNATAMLAQPDIDGALVGGASLIAADFAAICAAPRQSIGNP